MFFKKKRSVMSGESSQSPADCAAAGRKRAPPTTAAPSTPSITDLKKSLTLDFSTAEKKTLQTPEVIRFLQLTSPELEKFLNPGGGVTVTTPTPTQILFPKAVTSQQQSYAQGFLDALNQLHNINGFSINANGGTPLLSPGFVVDTVSANASEPENSRSESAPSSSNILSSLTSVPVVVSPTRATSTAPLSSVIMHPFHNSLPTNPATQVAFPNGLNPASIGNAMAMMGGLKREPDDRPPSQSLPPGQLDFMNLSQANVPSSVTEPYQVMPPHTTHYLPEPPMHRPAPVSRASNGCIVKPEVQQDVHMVPNVSEAQLGYAGSSAISVNMHDQEKMKLERKRERNRVAADKCRKRKLERITVLESHVKDAEDKRKVLDQHLSQLRHDVKQLRTQVQNHNNGGCVIAVKRK